MMKKSRISLDLDNEQHMRLIERTRQLTRKEAKVMLQFLEELVMCYDPDVVDDFVQMRKDPRLVSVLQLASRLSDETLDQLLFLTEDLFASEQMKH